jgi:hydrogenase nickel incorporation protein HypA/HybF
VHELAIAQAIVDAVTRHSDHHQVTRVDVRIGHFRQVVPDSLQFSWALREARARGT